MCDLKKYKRGRERIGGAVSLFDVVGFLPPTFPDSKSLLLSFTLPLFTHLTRMAAESCVPR